MKNETYWDYNLPLQYWPRFENEEEESGNVIGSRILNYMPRKERCCEMSSDDDYLGEQTHEEFFECAAKHCENLARLFRNVAKDPSAHVYYHDEGMDVVEGKESVQQQ